MSRRYLSREETRRIYDRIGPRQDWQGFYEGPALRELLAAGCFSRAKAVFEMGCGTGSLAEILLDQHLPATAIYRGADLSPRMVGLARQRLARFGPRAGILLTTGEIAQSFPASTFDRYVATYMLDLLPPAEIEETLGEAHRLLPTGGLLCLVSLSWGKTFLSRAFSRLWDRFHRLNPRLVGGCRPIELLDHLNKDKWLLKCTKIVQAFGIPSEVVVAVRRDWPTE